MKLPPVRNLLSARLVVALAALAAIARADSWRLVPFVLLAIAATFTTRTRYRSQVAVGLLIAVAALAVAGRGPAAAVG